MKYELLERHFFRSIGFSSSSKTFVAGDQLETWEERQETCYVILEGVARKLSAYVGIFRRDNFRSNISYCEISLPKSACCVPVFLLVLIFLSCASFQCPIYSELSHGWNWNEELATIGSSEAICVPTRLHSHVSSCIS